MPKKLNDIIYILREAIDPYELTYSLRSVEKNFPHRKVWFIGGKPKGLTPDVMIEHKQSGVDKWDNIRSSMMKAIFECQDLADDFFLFNDDFFVMKPFKGKFVNYTDHTLSWRTDELHAGLLRHNAYALTLIKAREELKSLGKGEINFEVHLPMLINKQKMKDCIYLCSSPQMRSVYGNYNEIPYIERSDVKVYDMRTVPKDPDFLSTNDKVFAEGRVGQFIRDSFPDPSRFET